MKINKIVGLSLALMLGLGVVSCGDTQVEEQPQQPQPQEQEYVEEEKEEVKEVKEVKEKEIMILKPDETYVKYDLQKDVDALNNAKEDEMVEIVAEVSYIKKTGTIGAVIYLDLDYPNDWHGYSIELKGLQYEHIKDLKEEDKIKVQGRYDGVGKWSLSQEGENIGSHHVYAHNIYKID